MPDGTPMAGQFVTAATFDAVRVKFSEPVCEVLFNLYLIGTVPLLRTESGACE